MWNVHTYVYGKLITFSKLQPIIRNIYVRTWYGRKIIFKINNMFLNLLRIKIEREIWHGTSLYKIWLVTEIKYQSFCLYPDKYINISPKQGESKKYNYRVCSGTHVKFMEILSDQIILQRNYRTVGFFFSIYRLMMILEDLRTYVPILVLIETYYKHSAIMHPDNY